VPRSSSHGRGLPPARSTRRRGHDLRAADWVKRPAGDGAPLLHPRHRRSADPGDGHRGRGGPLRAGRRRFPGAPGGAPRRGDRRGHRGGATCFPSTGADHGSAARPPEFGGGAGRCQGLLPTAGGCPGALDPPPWPRPKSGGLGQATAASGARWIRGRDSGAVLRDRAPRRFRNGSIPTQRPRAATTLDLLRPTLNAGHPTAPPPPWFGPHGAAGEPDPPGGALPLRR